MLALIRIWIPAALCTAGIVVVIVGTFSEESLEVGIPVFSSGASIWLLNFLYRVGVAGDKDRDTESEAREYFAEHGRWPDEDRRKPGGGPDRPKARSGQEGGR